MRKNFYDGASGLYVTICDGIEGEGEHRPYPRIISLPASLRVGAMLAFTLWLALD